MAPSFSERRVFMEIKLHFSHTEVPEDVRLHIESWLYEHLSDHEPKQNLQVELFCTKDCEKPKSGDARFKVSMIGRAPWLKKTLTVKSSGLECWGTILDCTHRFRQQLSKQRRRVFNDRRKVNLPDFIELDENLELTPFM